MATVDGVLTEIRDMANLAEKRSDKPQLLMGLATSISSKVATIKAFGAGQADQLYEAIRVLQSEYQELVSTSVDDRLRGGAFVSWGELHGLSAHALYDKLPDPERLVRDRRGKRGCTDHHWCHRPSFASPWCEKPV